MKTDTAAIGAAYYTALGEKNMDKVKQYLHPEIQFKDPQEKVTGRETVLNAAKGFSSVFKKLSVRAKFGSDDQAVIIYEVEIPGLAKNLQAASYLGFKDGLISSIELFYDTKSMM